MNFVVALFLLLGFNAFLFVCARVCVCVRIVDKGEKKKKKTTHTAIKQVSVESVLSEYVLVCAHERERSNHTLALVLSIARRENDISKAG